MTEAEALFHNIVNEVPEVVEGKMFGALCLKSFNGKAAAIFWKDCMLFKLDDEAQKEALKLDGAQIGSHLYDSKKPMKGWISIPFKHSHRWVDFARMSIKNV